ncbi:MAG TPA: tetratricopeptide repeat protein [Thermoanaerobaculia bacterium]|nr:tetratricopeptide repeat protein [Thermoanaerobaculia bacterium]
MELRRSRLASAERVRELVDAAFASRYHDIEAMLKLSSAAVALAEEKSHEIPVDLLVVAWTQYGNALRIAGRHQEAEKALDRAAALPASDPPTKIHLLEIRAAVHRNTGRFESAAEFLTAAIDAHKSIGDSNAEARTWNLLGIVCLDAGDLPRALRAFRTALDLFGPDAPLDVVTSTGHNLVKALIEAGRLGAAASALALLEPLYRRLTSARLAAKAEWMRARLCRELKQFPAAQFAYERAHALLITEPRSPRAAQPAQRNGRPRSHHEHIRRTRVNPLRPEPLKGKTLAESLPPLPVVRACGRERGRG